MSEPLDNDQLANELNAVCQKYKIDHFYFVGQVTPTGVDVYVHKDSVEKELLDHLHKLAAKSVKPFLKNAKNWKLLLVGYLSPRYWKWLP